MVHGNATVQSQMMPGQDILIMISSLWRDTFGLTIGATTCNHGLFYLVANQRVRNRLQRVTKLPMMLMMMWMRMTCQKSKSQRGSVR
jgi:hypothetical protein